MTYAPDATSDDGARPEESNTRRSLGCLLEIVETLVLTLVIYLLIHNFIAQPFEVEQDSMLPTILEHEYVLIDKLSPRFSDYDRGDIVVFQPPEGFEQGGVPVHQARHRPAGRHRHAGERPRLRDARRAGHR